MAQGGTSAQSAVLKGQLKRGPRRSLHKQSHGEDKGQQLQVAPGQVSP